MRIQALIGTAAALLVGGCQQAAIPPAPPAGGTPVLASPCDLFTGGLKRLEPHLCLTTGCIHLDFTSELFVETRIDFWQDGKVSEGDRGATRVAGPGEASISLHEMSEGGKRCYRMVTATSGKSGGGSSNRKIDMPDLGKAWGSHVAKLEAPVELQEDKPVAVWALLTFEGLNNQDSQRGGTIEEQAKRAKWAVVMKVTWQKPKD